MAEKAAEPETKTAAAEEAPPPPEATKLSHDPPPPGGVFDSFKVDVGLRGLLLAATVTALVVMSTAEQTVMGRKAKFSHSPAFIYLVASLCVASTYTIITLLASVGVILKPHLSTKFLLHFIFMDVLMLGIVSTATAAAGGVAYIGLKGNKHAGWSKVCSAYEKYCNHLGSSIAISLLASVILLLLVFLSVLSLHRKIPPPA
ncbi:CASP-like protein 1D2 [Linum grandiflorum]